jgi:hypothetical protein
MALSFGTCIHHALFIWNATGSQAEALAEFSKICDENDIPLTDDKRSKTNGAAILLAYFAQYEAERKLEERIAGEVGFCLPLPEMDDVMVVGKIDYLFRRDGKLRARDHKTASQIGASYKYNVNPALAPNIYTWAIESILEEKIQMFDIDALLVAVQKRENVRFPLMRSQWRIDSALEDFRQAARDIRSKIKSGEFDRNTKHCSSYGGCDYHDICTTQNPASIIDSMFVKEVWRPYAAD